MTIKRGGWICAVPDIFLWHAASYRSRCQSFSHQHKSSPAAVHKQWVTPPPKEDPNPLDKCGTLFLLCGGPFCPRQGYLRLLCSFCKIKQQWVILLSPGSLEVVKGGSRIRLHCGVQATGVRGRGGRVWEGQFPSLSLLSIFRFCVWRMVTWLPKFRVELR